MNYTEYYETKKHGEDGFPIELYVIDEEHPRYVMPLHWHGEFEIVRVTSGKLDLYVNNVKESLFENDIGFVNCRMLHRAQPQCAKYECIVVNLDMMVKKHSHVYSSYVNPITRGSLATVGVYRNKTGKLYSGIDRLFEIMREKEPYYELSVMRELFTVLEELYANKLVSEKNLPSGSIGQINMMSNLTKWIDENYAEHITLEKLAKLACITPNHLCRVFKEYTGKTPIEYVNSARIENACQKIRLEKKSVTEAAGETGFNDISYFCRVFKKHTGSSAKQYAKQEEKGVKIPIKK